MSGQFIALDWGTSTFRAYLADRDGRVQDKRASAEGILSIAGGAFEPVFERQLAGWDASLPVIASGMIGSRQGWHEAPYVPAPAGAAELSAGLLRFRTSTGRPVAFVPGVSVRAENGVPDVMRGEETQIFGAHSGRDGVFVMRGTHCKWARVEQARIVGFATFMTGELFAVLKAHSILGRLMSGEADTGPAFQRGVAAGLAGGKAGGLLHDLFAVRTLGLLGELPGDQLASYLSGLLIGSEINAATGLFPAAVEGVTVIGSPSLAAAFRLALDQAGLRSEAGPDEAAVKGLARIGRQAGVIA